MPAALILMPVTVARSLDHALAALEECPEAIILAGGTDVMVQVNRGSMPVDQVVAIGRIPELQGWSREGDWLHLGAGVTYSEMMGEEISSMVPALAQASRTVGLPQIRNAGTIGGNLGTSSPAGDTLPTLFALEAVLTIRSSTGVRKLPINQFIVGVKQNALQPGELIEKISVPVLEGPQEFCKIGPRNAMVISVASFTLLTDVKESQVRSCLGTVGPVPIRPTEAENLLSNGVNWEKNKVSSEVLEAFASLCADAAQPIDDHRGSAAYRRHAIKILSRRAACRIFSEDNS